jgi:hypothetical protein
MAFGNFGRRCRGEAWALAGAGGGSEFRVPARIIQNANARKSPQMHANVPCGIRRNQKWKYPEKNFNADEGGCTQMHADGAWLI